MNPTVLKQLRTEHKLTQADLGKILNTTAQYYQKYEKGKHPLPIEHLEKLCLFYQVSADYILGLPRNLDYPR